MKRIIRGTILIAGLLLFISTMNVWQDFLYAQDQRSYLSHTDDATNSSDATNTKDAANTGDATNTGDTTPEDQDTQRITISFDVAGGHSLNQVKVLLNGKEYSYNSSEFENDVLTMTVSKKDTQLIEFEHTGFYFEPSYILLNEKAPDIRSNYRIKATYGSEPSFDEYTITDARNNERSEFEHDETAYINLYAKKPMTVILYTLGSKTYIYNKPIQIQAQSEEAHTYGITYHAVRYYPGDSIPTLDDDYSNEKWTSVEVHFKAKAGTPDNPDNPDNPDQGDQSDLTYVDKAGNKYSEKDVKLHIEALKNITQYKKVITAAKEFQDIPEAQISYLDISLKASTIEVQPLNSYSLVIPYPKGSDQYDQFVIYHFKEGDVKKAEQLTYIAKKDGLHVSVKSFSPFVVGWKDKAGTTPTDPTTPDPKPTKPTTPTNPSNNSGTPSNNSNNSNNTNTVSGVKTGDSTLTGGWIGLSLLTFSILIAYRYRKRNIEVE